MSSAIHRLETPSTTAHAPRVAIVMLSFNKKADALVCLASARQLATMPLVVIMVDNASTDGSADAVADAFPEVTIIRNRINLGASGGRNVGWRFVAAHTDADLVFFLDDDARLEPDTLTKLVEVLDADPRAGIACGKAYTRYPSRTIMSVGVRFNRLTGAVYDLGAGHVDHGQFDRACYVDACGGFAWLIRRQVLERLGGLDERFNPYGWEDVDFCLRASSQGAFTRYVPDAVLYHGGGKIGRRPVFAYERQKVSNYFVLLRRHLAWWQWPTCVICVPLRALRVVGRLLRKGHARIIGAHLLGFWQGVRTLRTPSETLTDATSETVRHETAEIKQ